MTEDAPREPGGRDADLETLVALGADGYDQHRSLAQKATDARDEREALVAEVQVWRKAAREVKDSLLDPFQGLSNYLEYNTPEEVVQRVRDAIKALEALAGEERP
jgi:uncharacterized coiled-coil DUF342 family protein